MSLPFLKSKSAQVAGLIIKHRTPDKKEGDEEQGPAEADHALEACAQDIIRAINDGDHKHLALALKAAFDCMESQPHEENNDYDSLNEKAAKDAQE